MSEIVRFDDHEIDRLAEQIIEAQFAEQAGTIQTYAQPLPPPVSASEAYRIYCLEQRRQEDLKHRRQNEAIGRLCLGIGAVSVFAVVLMAVFVGLVKSLQPAPPPPVNPKCWIGCSAEVSQ